MKIDPKSLDGLYETKSNQSIRNGKTQISNEADRKTDTVTKQDRIEISEKGTRHGEVLAVKTSLVNEVKKETSAEKIQRLTEEVKNGTYFVSSSDIAEAILKLK